MDVIAQFIGLLIFLIIALAYSIVYAIIANYSVNYIFKKNKSKKPKLLNLLFFFIIIFSLITFFKFYRKTSYGDFNERFIPISKGYRLENNEVNMTYYYPNTNKEDFNNGDGIFLNKFEFNDNYIYGKFPKRTDKDVFYVDSKKNDSLKGDYIVHNLDLNEILTFTDSIKFNDYAVKNNLLTSNNLKTFDEKYSDILKKNKWKKILFLQY